MERNKPCPKELILFVQKVIKDNPTATYKEIVAKGKELRPTLFIQTCWIAEVKEIMGLPVRTAWNRGKCFNKS